MRHDVRVPPPSSWTVSPPHPAVVLRSLRQAHRRAVGRLGGDRRRHNTLVIAPTGSGKTLSAFLWALDRLATTGADRGPGTRVLYVSPLKALGVDVERNLRPADGHHPRRARTRCPGTRHHGRSRSGDTEQATRRALIKTPPDILITTPESLYLMLTSAARETLRHVDTVIVDEVHAVAATKRGTHLALSSNGSMSCSTSPRSGSGCRRRSARRRRSPRSWPGPPNATSSSRPPAKTFDLRVDVPRTRYDQHPAARGRRRTRRSVLPAAGSLWPHIETSIVDAVERNRSTIVFANSRRLAERLTARLNEIHERRQSEGGALAPRTPNRGVPGGSPAHVMGSGSSAGSLPVLARAHHGSVSKDQRAQIEDDLKAGRLRCVVATSSLELGIDMGAVDLVIQVESAAVGGERPATRRPGRTSGGRDQPGRTLPPSTAPTCCTAPSPSPGCWAARSSRCASRRIRSTCSPSTPSPPRRWESSTSSTGSTLSARHRIGSTSVGVRRRPRSDLRTVSVRRVRRAAAPGHLGPDGGTLTGRRGRNGWRSPPVAPSRPGSVRVYLIGEKVARVGELDEEMVYESRVGDVFALGASSWRIEDITHDRVLVSPAFGQPGRLPFWLGDSVGRPNCRWVLPSEDSPVPSPTTPNWPRTRHAWDSPTMPATTSLLSSASNARPPDICPPTKPLWWNAFATNWATGG